MEISKLQFRRKVELLRPIRGCNLLRHGGNDTRPPQNHVVVAADSTPAPPKATPVAYLKTPSVPNGRAVVQPWRPRDVLRRPRTGSPSQETPPAAVWRRSRRPKRPRAPSRCRRPRPAAADAKLRLARVKDGMGRQVQHPGDEGHGDACHCVPESPHDGFLALKDAWAGNTAIRGRPVEHSKG